MYFLFQIHLLSIHKLILRMLLVSDPSNLHGGDVLLCRIFFKCSLIWVNTTFSRIFDSPGNKFIGRYDCGTPMGLSGFRTGTTLLTLSDVGKVLCNIDCVTKLWIAGSRYDQ